MSPIISFLLLGAAFGLALVSRAYYPRLATTPFWLLVVGFFLAEAVLLSFGLAFYVAFAK